MGYISQESLENTINTMGTLIGVHPIVLWKMPLPNIVTFSEDETDGIGSSPNTMIFDATVARQTVTVKKFGTENLWG